MKGFGLGSSRRAMAAAMIAGSMVVVAAPAQARTYAFNIAPQNLSSALRLFSQQSGRSVVYTATGFDQMMSPGVQGQWSDRLALEHLLASTRLSVQPVEGGFVIRLTGQPAAPAAEPRADAAPSTTLPDQAAIQNEGDIVVTARRREETAQNTPVPLTVLNAALLDRYGIKGVGTIAQLIPGLITGETSGSVGGSIALRGVGSGESQPFIDQAVSMNVDGVQISTAQLLRAAELDLKQVEVLRGPQALFFGKNSPGGIISLVSADPGDKLEALVRGGYEIEAQEKYVDATISTPLTDTLGLRVAGHYSNMNGYMNVISPDVPVGLTPTNLTGYPKQQEYFLRGTLAFKPSADLTIRLKGTYTHTNIDGGPSLYTTVVACPYGAPQESPIVNNCKNDETVITSQFPAAYIALSPLNLASLNGGRINTQVLLAGTVDYKLNDALTLTSVTGYYDVREKESSNGSYDVSANYGFAVGFSTSQATEELRLASKFQGPFNFLAGGYFESRKLYTATFLAVPSILLPLYDTESTHQKQTAYSAFGEAMIDVLPKLQFSGGGRYTHEIKDLLDYTLAYPGQAPVDVTKESTYPGNPYPEVAFNNFSPEITLSYKPQRDIMFYASYKQGFKSGGFDASYTAGAIASPVRQSVGQTFKPEKVHGGEIGMKSELLDRQLTFNLDGYWYDYTDLQVSSFDNVAHTFLTKNAAGSRVRGVELETSWRPQALPGFNLHASGNFNDAKFTSYLANCYTGQSQQLGCNPTLINGVTADVQNLAGQRLRKAPVWTMNLGAYYEFPLKTGLLMSLSSDLAYSSSYMAGSDYEPLAMQGAFAKLDATMRVFTADKRWEFALIGRNLTNTLNLVNATDRPLTGSGKGDPTTCTAVSQKGSGCDLLSDIIGTPALPRSIALQATFKY